MSKRTVNRLHKVDQSYVTWHNFEILRSNYYCISLYIMWNWKELDNSPFSF